MIMAIGQYVVSFLFFFLLLIIFIKVLSILIGLFETSEKKKKKIIMGKIMAHRGGRNNFPENSILAFMENSKFVDSFELDVWLTKDNQVVVFHDSNLERMCGIKGKIKEFNYLELPAIRKGPSEGYDQGFSNDAIPSKIRIPLLSQVLDIIVKEKHLTVLIEFKDYSKILATSVHQMIQEKGLLKENRVAWFSLEYRISKLIRNIGPEVPCHPSIPELVLYIFAHRMGILNLCRVPFHGFAISTSITEELLEETLSENFLFKKVPQNIHQYIVNKIIFSLDDPSLFIAMKSRGLECWMLNVNNEKQLEFALKMGTECFITDKPEWLKTVLAK